jgi:hypothetical protein
MPSTDRKPHRGYSTRDAIGQIPSLQVSRWRCRRAQCDTQVFTERLAEVCGRHTAPPSPAGDRGDPTRWHALGSGRLWATWRARHDAAAVLTLFLAEVLAQRPKIVIKPREEFLAGCARFLDDRVFPHGRHLSMSSCGVQMTGGSYPDALHCLSIARRIVALAMCVQFHESKYSMP